MDVAGEGSAPEPVDEEGVSARGLAADAPGAPLRPAWSFSLSASSRAETSLVPPPAPVLALRTGGPSDPPPWAGAGRGRSVVAGGPEGATCPAGCGWGPGYTGGATGGALPETVLGTGRRAGGAKAGACTPADWGTAA